ncbi:MAG: hypothetical protein P4K98_12175 [Bryobacteraceae bacterium]|nr:hypothetical protein [Bryobacteraceae bacterium]
MAHNVLRQSLLWLAVLATGACAHRRAAAPETWRFDVSNVPDRVIPPAEAVPVKGVYHIPVPGLQYARPECHAEGGEFALVRSGKGLALQFPQTVLQSEGHDPADAWDLFRDAELRLEDNACLPRDSIQELSRQLLGAVELTTRSAYGIRYGNYERSGAVNLEPGFRLKVVAPLLQPGFKEVKIVQSPNAPGEPLSFTAEGLDGYETAYYAVQPRDGGGVQFVLNSVEQNRMSVITHPDKPAGFEFPLVPDAHYFRLMFLRRASIADRDISLLGAPEWGPMLDAAQRFDTVPGAVDDCAKVPGLVCIALARQTAILAEVGIEANGRIVYLPVGGTLGGLVGNRRETGARRVRALSGVKVERPWHGRMVPIELDSNNPRSSGLVLIAGDRVTW